MIGKFTRNVNIEEFYKGEMIDIHQYRLGDIELISIQQFIS